MATATPTPSPARRARLSPVGAALGAGLRALLKRRIRLLDDERFWQRSTAAVQLRQLRIVLQTAAATEFGRTHGFERLTRLPDAELVGAYRQAVPAGDYEAYRPLVARMREEGVGDVLWPGVVRRFAQTSGTTAGDKYFPVSRHMMRSNRRCALDIFAMVQRFGTDVRQVLRGKVMFLGGSTALESNRHGIATGDLSGIVTPLIRWPVSRVYLPGRAIALMSHWPGKIEAMARACLDADVRMIAGMPSWMLVLFERMLHLARERGQNAATIADLWPGLRVLVHGGVKYAPFEPRVRQYWGGRPDGPDVPLRVEIYPASEGFIAMQDRPGDPGLRLCSDARNFYEFIPLGEVGKPDARAFTAETVEKGQRYVVCMTTCAGLYRYIIGDVVEFDTVPDRLAGGGGDGPARLRIVGRHRHFINAFGENLIVEHVENAVAAAARAAGVVVGEFTAGPVYPGQEGGRTRSAAVELAVEVEGSPSAGAIASFRDAFDAALKGQNVDYTTKRTGEVGMVEPTITVLPLGSFHRWMESRGKLGGQHKCPRCANGRDYLDGVRSVVGLTPVSADPPAAGGG